MSEIHTSFLSSFQDPLIIVGFHSFLDAFICAFDGINGVFISAFDIFNGGLIRSLDIFQGVVKVLFGTECSIDTVVNGRKDPKSVRFDSLNKASLVTHDDFCLTIRVELMMKRDNLVFL